VVAITCQKESVATQDQSRAINKIDKHTRVLTLNIYFVIHKKLTIQGARSTR